MAKYLIKARYTAEGVRGLLKGGGSARRTAVEQMVNGLGGTLESFYFAIGESDAIVIFDVPNVTTAAAASLVVNATGAVHVSTTQLITTEEIDEACKISVEYRSPGA